MFCCPNNMLFNSWSTDVDLAPGVLKPSIPDGKINHRLSQLQYCQGPPQSMNPVETLIEVVTRILLLGSMNFRLITIYCRYRMNEGSCSPSCVLICPLSSKFQWRRGVLNMMPTLQRVPSTILLPSLYLSFAFDLSSWAPYLCKSVHAIVRLDEIFHAYPLVWTPTLRDDGLLSLLIHLWMCVSDRRRTKCMELIFIILFQLRKVYLQVIGAHPHQWTK